MAIVKKQMEITVCDFCNENDAYEQYNGKDVCRSCLQKKCAHETVWSYFEFDNYMDGFYLETYCQFCRLNNLIINEIDKYFLEIMLENLGGVENFKMLGKQKLARSVVDKIKDALLGE